MKKIDQILESLYDRVIEPIEAKERLLDLFTVSKSVYDKCEELQVELNRCYEAMEEYANQQLQLGGVVGQSEQLPTKEDFISELEQHQEKHKLAHIEEVNNAYTLGFRHCFNFINDRVKLK